MLNEMGGNDFAPIGEAQDPATRVKKYKQWFKQSHDQSEEWRLKAIESYQFVQGDQWSAEDIDRLNRQRRPHLTINRVLAPVSYLSGLQRAQRTKPQLIPFESGDARACELMNALLEYIGNCSRESRIDSQVFLDKIITGIGWWKISLDFDDDPEGEPIWERLHPLSVFWDPNAFDVEWKKCEYVIHATWMGMEDAQSRWPEHKDEIRKQFGEWLGGENASGSNLNLAASGEMAGDSFADKRLFWDAATQRIRVLEVFYVRRVPVTVVEDTVTKEVTADETGVANARALVKGNPEAKDRLIFHKRSVKQIRMAHVLGQIELDEGESPYKENCFPIFPTLGYYFWRRPMGIVEPMKDPQREGNKRRSTIVEMVQRMPHSGFFNKRTGGAKTDDIEKFATGNGAVINYDDTPPNKIEPPELPQTLVWLDQRNDGDVRSVVNINNELLGNNTQRTVSGRAIEARQRGGATTQEPLIDSFEEDKENATRFMVTVIQQFTSLRKAARILGSIANRNPNSPAAGVMAQTPPIEVIQLLSDAFDQKYDVEVRSQPSDQSQNRLRWQAITELLEMFKGEVPPKVICESLRDAGIITESQMADILAFQQEKQMMQQMAAMPQAQGQISQQPQGVAA